MKKLAGILALMLAGSSVAAEHDQPVPAPEATAAFWTTDYSGPDLAAMRCAAPDVPEVSQSNLRIRNVARAIKTWQDCHRRTMASLEPAQAVQHIPAEALAAMTPAERAAALRHVAAIHGRLGDAIQRDAAVEIARHEAWLDATVRYVVAHNGMRAGDAALRRNEQFARAARADELLQLRIAAGRPVR